MFENEEKIEVVDLETVEEIAPTEETLKGLEDLGELTELNADELEEVSGGRHHHSSSTTTYVKCTSHSVHIRANCSARSAILGYMSHGKKLLYLGTYRNTYDRSLWYKVSSKKGIGYVSALYTTLV